MLYLWSLLYILFGGGCLLLVSEQFGFEFVAVWIFVAVLLAYCVMGFFFAFSRYHNDRRFNRLGCAVGAITTFQLTCITISKYGTPGAFAYADLQQTTLGFVDAFCLTLDIWYSRITSIATGDSWTIGVRPNSILTRIMAFAVEWTTVPCLVGAIIESVDESTAWRERQNAGDSANSDE